LKLFSNGHGLQTVIKSVFTYLFLGLVKTYQYLISPWLAPSCRFTPTCSQYAIEALKEWGPWKGLLLTVKRISRCHPWGGSGYDPVPEKNKKG
jgi:hypothetical protein